MIALDWAHPAGLLALALPLVLYLLARARSRPPEFATGTLEIWPSLPRAAVLRASRARRSVPSTVWLLIGALAAGALAAAGPRVAGPRAPRLWTLLVDHSPSTSLPHRLSSGDAKRRIDVALERARAWLAENGEAGDRVVWRSAARPQLELPFGERPSAEWLAHPPWFAPEPEFELDDTPASIWVTDRAPLAPAQRAGCFASGGESVAGPIACDGRTRIDWNGSALVAVENAIEERTVALDPGRAALPDELVELFALWARERGFSVSEGPRAMTERSAARVMTLEAAGPATGPEPEVEGGRDLWRARGRAIPGGLLASAFGDPPGEVWLASEPAGGESWALVLAAPGRVKLAWRELESLSGDPAAFALSWSRLFDRCVLPPSGIVPLAERADAGASFERAPRAGEASVLSGGADEGHAIDAWLAGGAALCALVAAWSAGRSARLPRSR